MVRRESAVEYFKELVDGALARQGIAAGELTAFYVVQLLAGFLQRRVADDAEPLALEARARARERRRPSSAPASSRSATSRSSSPGSSPTPFGASWSTSTTTSASAAAPTTRCSRHETDTFSPVFAELADNFVSFVDVLSEVSERSACGSNADLLRLYERWLKTGSRRSGQLLVERGVVPNASLRGSQDSVDAQRCELAYTSTIFRHACRLLRVDSCTAVRESNRIRPLRRLNEHQI